MRYRCDISARKKGAIGSFSRFEIEVEAENEDAARLALYDTHDHVHVVRITPVDPNGEKSDGEKA